MIFMETTLNAEQKKVFSAAVFLFKNRNKIDG